MFGAHRPPWITESEFIRTPFNYCDRWCERCKIAASCKVKQKSDEDRAWLIAQGKDPDSTEGALAVVAKNFHETMVLVAKKAEEIGIDLNSLDDSDFRKPPRAETYELYRLSRRLSDKLQKTPKLLEIVPVGVDEKLIIECLEVIAFYCHFFTVKLARAYFSRWKEKEDDPDLQTNDDKTSAYLAVRALLAAAESLTKLAKHKPLGMKPCFTRLAKTSLNLAEAIDLEFNLEVIHVNY